MVQGSEVNSGPGKNKACKEVLKPNDLLKYLIPLLGLW